jgi:hypothetical protein
MRLDLFEPGVQYEVGNRLAALFLAEGWAVPVNSDEPTMVIPISEFDPAVEARQKATPSNLEREFWASYYEATPGTDRRRRRRTPRSKSN